jgi:uncharacterized protein YndB with AHSA1/START domain
MAEAAAAARADHELEIRRVFSAGREAVFRAWTVQEELAQWWGPQGFSAHIDHFDARSGGSYRIDMRSPDGTSRWLRGEFREVTPPERLVMTWVWEQGDLADLEMLVTVDFSALEGATEVRLTHSRLPSAGAKDAHNQGWTSTLECFTQFLVARS